MMENKKYLPEAKDLIIKKFKLVKNYYTQNDYLYIRQYKDYTISYNPRFQLLDISPTDRIQIPFKKFYLHECLKMREIAKKVWNDFSYEVFLNFGIVIDNYVYCRLYGVSTDNGSNFPFITQLSSVDIGDFTEVADWSKLNQKYKKDKYFKYASFGSEDDYKRKPTAIENKFVKLALKKNKYKNKFLTNQTYLKEYL